MKKRKKKRGIPAIGTVLLLKPSRRSTTPFCAYYGPHGETCACTKDLAWVYCIPGMPGMPPMGYMACPQHYADVEQTVTWFLASVTRSLSDEQ